MQLTGIISIVKKCCTWWLNLERREISSAVVGKYCVADGNGNKHEYTSSCYYCHHIYAVGILWHLDSLSGVLVLCGITQALASGLPALKYGPRAVMLTL